MAATDEKETFIMVSISLIPKTVFHFVIKHIIIISITLMQFPQVNNKIRFLLKWDKTV